MLVVLEAEEKDVVGQEEEEDEVKEDDGFREVVVVDVEVGFLGPGEKGYDGRRCEKVGDGGYCLMATVGLTVDRGADMVGRCVEDRIVDDDDCLVGDTEDDRVGGVKGDVEEKDEDDERDGWRVDGRLEVVEAGEWFEVEEEGDGQKSL